MIPICRCLHHFRILPAELVRERDMTLVFEAEKPAGAKGQTHVFIVGVSAYPWLVDGAHARGPEVTDSMGQLHSPALSARAVAEWCVRQFRNLERPLGSVDLLLSDSVSQNYQDADGAVHAIEPADIDNVRDAALRWKARGDLNPEDMLVFFFSGHGIAAGTRNALLTRDYGRINGRPLLGAISLLDMIEGMKSCKALRQIYFIDACRVASDILLLHSTECGDVLVPASLPLTRGICQSVYFATLAEKAAYGRLGKVTLFTNALLRALVGPAANNAEGDWRINTSRLQEALNHFSTTLADPQFGSAQMPNCGNHTTFDFHFLDGKPEVPVYVQPDWHQGLQPPGDMAEIAFRVDKNSEPPVVSWSPPWTQCDQCSWEPNRFLSWIEGGRSYNLRVAMNDGTTLPEIEEHIMPPFKLFKVSR